MIVDAGARALAAAYLRALADRAAIPDLRAGPVLADDPELEAALEAAVARFRADLTRIARVANDAASGAAENAFLLRRIADAVEQQSAETAQVAAAVHETAQAAAIVAESADATRTVTERLRAVATGAAATVGATIADLDRLREQAGSAVADVARVVARSDEIERAAEVIDDISTRTNLLALNAAIEAARAGQHGRGFAVVASEIRKLADSTRTSTREIATLVRGVREAVASARTATERSAAETIDAVDASRRVGDDLGEVTRLVDDASGQVAAIAAAVEQQSSTFSELSRTVEALDGHARAAASHAAQARSLGLGAFNTEIVEVTGRFMLGMFFDKIRAWGHEFAGEVERVLETAVDRGLVRLEDLFDADYRELRGADVRSLQRLFDTHKVGPEGFAPPKYRTRYDHAIDEALAPICDRFTDADPNVVFASVTDLNAFAVMVPRSLRRDITGDRLRDLEGNRVKRIFSDAVGLQAARVGLDGALEAPERAPRTEFARRGVDLRRPAGPRALVLQTYARDTGKIYNDVAFPIYVKDQRFGCVRLAYDPKAA